MWSAPFGPFSSRAAGVAQVCAASLSVISKPRAFASGLDRVCLESPTVVVGQFSAWPTSSCSPLRSPLCVLPPPLVQSIGVAHCSTAPRRLSVAPGWFPQLLASSARALGQFNACVCKSIPPDPRASLLSRCSGPRSAAFGVAQDEAALALVNVAEPGRSRKDRLREVETQVAKSLAERPKMSACKPLWNILEPDQGGVTLFDDPREVHERSFPVAVASLVRVAESLPRAAVGLAGRASNEDVDVPPQRSGVQAADAIDPNRSTLQRLVDHPRHERGRRSGLPLNVTHGSNGVSESFKREHDGGVVEPAAGEGAEDVDGVSHTYMSSKPPRCG